jgi:hypothetical protein
MVDVAEINAEEMGEATGDEGEVAEQVTLESYCLLTC